MDAPRGRSSPHKVIQRYPAWMRGRVEGWGELSWRSDSVDYECRIRRRRGCAVDRRPVPNTILCKYKLIGIDTFVAERDPERTWRVEVAARRASALQPAGS